MFLVFVLLLAGTWANRTVGRNMPHFRDRSVYAPQRPRSQEGRFRCAVLLYTCGIISITVMKHNERARVAPLPFVHRKYMNGRLRRVAACGGLRPAAACGNRSPRRRSLPLATLPPATLLFATLPACGGLRPPDAPRRRPAAPPCGGVPQPRPAAAARLRPWYSSPARAFGAAAAG